MTWISEWIRNRITSSSFKILVSVVRNYAISPQHSLQCSAFLAKNSNYCFPLNEWFWTGNRWQCLVEELNELIGRRCQTRQCRTSAGLRGWSRSRDWVEVLSAEEVAIVRGITLTTDVIQTTLRVTRSSKRTSLGSFVIDVLQDQILVVHESESNRSKYRMQQPSDRTRLHVVCKQIKYISYL